MTDPARTYLVECFAPGIDDAAVAAAADRVRAVIATRPRAADGLAYLGALLMAEDEVVFHAFRGIDPDRVRETSEAAGLVFERVVESVGVPATHVLDREVIQRLISADVDTLGPGAATQQEGAIS